MTEPRLFRVTLEVADLDRATDSTANCSASTANVTRALATTSIAAASSSPSSMCPKVVCRPRRAPSHCSSPLTTSRQSTSGPPDSGCSPLTKCTASPPATSSSDPGASDRSTSWTRGEMTYASARTARCTRNSPRVTWVPRGSPGVGAGGGTGQPGKRNEIGDLAHPASGGASSRTTTGSRRPCRNSWSTSSPPSTAMRRRRAGPASGVSRA